MTDRSTIAPKKERRNIAPKNFTRVPRTGRPGDGVPFPCRFCPFMLAARPAMKVSISAAMTSGGRSRPICPASWAAVRARLHGLANIPDMVSHYAFDVRVVRYQFDQRIDSQTAPWGIPGRRSPYRSCYGPYPAVHRAALRPAQCHSFLWRRISAR